MLGGTNSVKPLSFSKQITFDPSQHDFDDTSNFADSARSSTGPQRSMLNSQYLPHSHRGFQDSTYSQEGEQEDVEYLDEDDDDYRQSSRSFVTQDTDGMSDEQGQHEDEDMDDYRSSMPGTRSRRREYDEDSNSDLIPATPNALKRTRDGTFLGSRDSMPVKAKTSVYGKIAKELCSQMGVPELEETDDIILTTENIIARMYAEAGESMNYNQGLKDAVRDVARDLTGIWGEYNQRIQRSNSDEYTTSIGPGPRAPNFSKANFVASLALQLHHPQIDERAFNHKPKHLPETLLEWLDDYHVPYPSQFEEVQLHRPSPANHRLFWDTIFNGLLRGKVVAVVNILKGAGWKHARVDLENSRAKIPTSQIGYTGQALINVERVVNAASQVLAQCPAAKGDWDTRGSDWTLFRLRVSQAVEDLKSFAEGRNRDRDDPVDFGSSAFKRSSMASQPDTYSNIAKKAGSQVPWDLYQRVLGLYGLMMGDAEAIMTNASDWCEATIGLLVWWDEGREEKRVALGRSSFSASSRDSDAVAYSRKLRKSFETATSGETDFQVNTLNQVEVALASLFEDDSEAVVGFLRGWSLPVSSAVAEVALAGGWLPRVEPQNLIAMGGFDEEDMDVLGLNASPSKSDSIKDQTLITYAGSLAHRGTLQSTGAFGMPHITSEGWEISIAILGRLESEARSQEMVGKFLDDLKLDSSRTVDKLWTLLNEIEMPRHAESTAKKYASSLTDDLHNYGEVMWYYALSHESTDVKDVLNHLISLSLIKSTAFPPADEMDDHLHRLISSPKAALSELAQMDTEAAELLHQSLSGYATLRKFYDLRDEEVLQGNGKNSQARKSEAARALLAVIASSDDNIRGGLYDEERGAVVGHEVLLALLGEAMVFVNQPNSVITVGQIDVLLKAIEDLQAVGPRVYTECTNFLEVVIASGQGLKGSTPKDMLRKSTSNISGTSSFSMVGSSMLASQLKQSISNSGVLVNGPIKRGWDWRRGVTSGTSGDDVLRILRLGLAKDLAKAWLSEVDGLL